MTIVVVLTILSITMALSFAVLRSQSSMLVVQENGNSLGNARTAAQTALSLGLRRMHDADWEGVTQPLSGRLSPRERYTLVYHTGVTDVAGNALLPPESDEEARRQWAFCVTLVATGYAKNLSSGNETEHRLRAVVRLSQPATLEQPARWTAMQDHTVYQWSDREVDLELPLQLAGNFYSQGELTLAEEYPPPAERAFDGLIDEVALFDKALIEEDIQLIYLASLGVLDTDTVETLLGGILGGGDEDEDEDEAVALDSLSDAYHYFNPIAWWSLDEVAGSSIAEDRIGTSDGVYEGADPGQAATFLGASNKAAKFDGVNDHVNLGTPDISGGDLTILAWFRADSFGAEDARIISKAYGTSEHEHYWMVSTAGSGGDMRLRFRVRAGGSTDTLVASSGDLPTGQWVFAACTYDGTAMRIYQNGVLVGQRTKTGNLNTNSTTYAFLGDNPPGSVRGKYLRDLEAMRQAGLEDHRPLTGSLAYNSEETDPEVLTLFEDELRLETSSVPEQGDDPVEHPGMPETYQLYPGGKIYTVPALNWLLAGETLEPDLVSNPLGIFRRDGSLTVYATTSVQGTLLISSNSGGDLNIYGEGISLSPVEIPRLDGSGSTFQLPVALANDDIRIFSSGQGSIQGAVLAWDDFEIHSGPADTSFAVTGRVMAAEFEIQHRHDWDQGDSWWRARLADYLQDRLSGGTDPANLYFPLWLKNYNAAFDPTPRFRFEADPKQPTYHWHDWREPLFSPASNNDGLKWELLEVQESD